jgi:hypothetical protein
VATNFVDRLAKRMRVFVSLLGFLDR